MANSTTPSYTEDGKMICFWGETDIVKARRTLRIKYNDAPCTPETIQAICDELERNHRYDPVQIERVIIAHFSKKKK